VTNVALVPDWVEREPSLPDAPALEAMFRFFGTDVRVRSANVGLLQHWATVYGAFRVPPGPAEITVRVTSAADGPPVPGQVVFEHGDDRRIWRGDGTVFPPLGMPPLDRWVHLRGAAVARAGRAVLLVGSPHCGKTLLAMAVVARGASLLSDGLLALDPHDLLLAPFPKTLRLRREVLAQLSIDPAHPALIPFRTQAGTVEWRADPRMLLGPRAARVAADVGAVVFLEPPDGPGDPHLEPVDPDQAFLRLLGHLHQRLSALVMAHGPLAMLSRRVPSFSLSLGSARHTARLLDQQLLD
jgi:hypothetical protein